MEIVIGCPIYNRAWILDAWFDSIESQNGLDLANTKLVFGLTEGGDNTVEIIYNRAEPYKEIALVNCNDLPAYGSRNPDRYYVLAEIRNRLLKVVRRWEPDSYFSWDTDILLPSNAFETLYADSLQVVAPFVDLMPPNYVVNCADKSGNYFVRTKPYRHNYPMNLIYKVDLVFACVLMDPHGYFVDYKWHQGGEDYGWGLNLHEKGVECWMDSRVVGQHYYFTDAYIFTQKKTRELQELYDNMSKEELVDFLIQKEIAWMSKDLSES